MLASFFKKSKPINFLLVGIFMALFFFTINFLDPNSDFTWLFLLEKIGFFLVYLFLMLLINFIVKRNQVTKKNTFTIYLFAVFTVLFLPILRAEEELVASLFILLALRRIVSMRSGLELKRKIFDASFWIAIAYLFYPESFVFILLPFIGILLYATEDFKNWLIPFFSIICVFILKTSFNLLFFDIFYNPLALLKEPSLSFTSYRELAILIPLSVLLTFTIWSLFNYFKILQKAARKARTTIYLVIATWVISIFTVLLAHQKTGAELLFFILPICIVGASYFEQKGEKLFKEILLVSLLVLTLILPFLTL